jgi:hypothetical protein
VDIPKYGGIRYKMKVFETLKELQGTVENESQVGQQREWLVVKPNESFRIRFRQELAKDGTGYNEEAGLAQIVPVHSSPVDFRKRVACNLDEEKFDFRCWPDEQIMVEKRWRPKPHLLINVAILDNGEWVNKILDQTFARSHIGSLLVEFAAEYGSITEHEYKLTRTGAQLKTTYSLIPVDRKPVDPSIEKLELFSLDGTYQKMSYEDQQEYFLKPETTQDETEKW